VLGLLEGLQSGEGLEGSLDPLIKAAMRGAGKMVEKELRADPDLREIGMTDGITKLVLGFLGNERNQEMVSDFAARAMRQAMGEAKREIRADADLRELGITGEVEGLIETLMRGGGDFDGQLQGLIEKAMRGASRQLQIELEEIEEPIEVEAEPTERKAKQAKKRAVVR
jgi:hypothetical protein